MKSCLSIVSHHWPGPIYKLIKLVAVRIFKTIIFLQSLNIYIESIKINVKFILMICSISPVVLFKSSFVHAKISEDDFLKS